MKPMFFTDCKVKGVRSKDFNFFFRKNDGFTTIWGKSLKDNPDYSPFGPLIADIEISTICSKGCPWCYKSNTTKGKNMSLGTFKNVFEELPKQTLTQIAFGIGDVDANPDMFPIFEYTRRNGVIPNVTINGSRLEVQTADRLADVCGAVAVSNYDKDTCYDAVWSLSKFGLKQVNIHMLLSGETYNKCLDTMADYKVDYRLDGLNAIVFLALKKKGRGENMTPVTMKQLEWLTRCAFETSVPIGFDSCSANAFLKVLRTLEKPHLEPLVEPCESSLFSAYIDVDGVFYPCSFSAGKIIGLPVIGRDFMNDVWNHYQTKLFRDNLIQNKRNCPIYEVINGSSN